MNEQKRGFTPIFDINKPFPKGFANQNKIFVKFKESYVIYLQHSLEYQFLFREVEFLARFKRVMYDGRIAPMTEIAAVRIPSEIVTCIDVKTNAFTLIDFEKEIEYFAVGDCSEYLDFRAINPKEYIETNRPYVISAEIFFRDFIEHYRLDNIYSSKLMKIYSSTYFDSFGSANSGTERLGVDSLTGEDLNYETEEMD